MSQSILVIDDDKVSHLILKKLASRLEGLSSLHFQDFNKLREFIEDFAGQSVPIDLVLLDLSMPQMSGWDFLEHFGTFFKEIPVLILTSSIDIKDIERARQHPLVNGYVVKPLAMNTLEKILAQYQQETFVEILTRDKPN